MRLTWADLAGADGNGARAEEADGATVELTGFPVAAGPARSAACFLLLPEAPCCAGHVPANPRAAVEVFAWCERNPQTRVARALRRPGFEIQRAVGTREPDERQLEVGRAAMAEILRAEERAG